MLATDLVAKSPYDDGRVIAVARNHLAHLLEAVRNNVGVRLIGHAFESVRAPNRDFALNENAVTVAIIEDTSVLWPMDARENTVQMFQVVVVVADPAVRLGHAELGIAHRRPFDNNRPHR